MIGRMEFIIYFLFTERKGRTGRISPEVFCELRTRKTELARVNKKFIIWFIPVTFYYPVKERLWVGVNETILPEITQN